MKLIIANLKMNLTLDKILDYKKIINEKQDNLIIAPPYIYLDVMKSQNYDIASQDGYYVDNGAYTGEVSFNQLKSMGVNYSIIGHSERRQKFNETNNIVKEKYLSSLRNGITPIVCVGETKEERLSNKTFDIIEEEIKVLMDSKTESIIIAYEPIWAIGTGLTPTLEEIESVHKFIKEILNKYNLNSKILYGGSVNLNNIKEFSKSDHIDGFLIGSASLDPNNLLNMINEIV